MTMNVAVMNLGESPRVFHNRLGRAVLVPVGKVVDIDLPGSVVQGLKHPSRPETVLIGEEGEQIPGEMQGVLDLLHTLEFESYESLVSRFLAVAPPNNLTQIRPSRMQMRVALRTMVEDWIDAQRHGEKVVHDDVDPEQLEQEQRDEDRNPKEPVHPLKKEKDIVAALNGVQSAHLIEQPPAEPPARPRPSSKKTRKAR